MAKITLRGWAKGLWLTGAADTIPTDALRRARGIAAIKDQWIRARRGSTLLRYTAEAAHSIVRFAGAHYYGIRDAFWRESAVIRSGLTEQGRLTFVAMPSTTGKAPVLFVAGGGPLFKVSAVGDVSLWGIAPPTAAPTPTKQTAPPNGFTQADGGAGVMSGVYQYYVTFYTTATGLESVPNPTPVTTANLTNRKIHLAALPTGGAGVTARRLYRTKTGGTAFFFLASIPDNATLTYDDNAADDTLGALMLQGVYQYKVTFLNTVTGHRSNGGPAASILQDTDRIGSILVTGIPTSTDPQVDARELWRTVGNGAVFFRLTTIAGNVVTTFIDTIADLALEAEALPDDNDMPFATFQDVAGPYQGRVLWGRVTTTGEKGRVYFSPIGRPEAMQDFLDLSTDEDPIQKVVLWNNGAWAFTTARLFQILGTDVLVPREFPEVPGTRHPFTIQTTPYGIVYEAHDGIRLFNGQFSQLVGPDAIERVFLGEALENVPAFTPIVSAFHEDEYLCSDGTQEILAVRLTDLSWRSFGFGANAMYNDATLQALLVARDTAVVQLEHEESLDDAGDAIDFEVEFAHHVTDTIEPVICQRLTLEANTRGQRLDLTLFLDGVATALPPCQMVGRQTVEYTIARPYRQLGLRVVGALHDKVELYAVTLDIYEPKVADLTRTYVTQVPPLLVKPPAKAAAG